MEAVAQISTTKVFAVDSNYAETHNFFISSEDYETILFNFKQLPNKTRKYARVYSANFAQNLLIKQMHEGLTPVLHVSIRCQTSANNNDYFEIRIKSTEPENRPEARHGCTITANPQDDDLLWISGLASTLAFFKI